MFEVSFADFFFLILLCSMIYIMILCLREWARRARHEWHLSNGQLFHCDKCHYSFIPKEARTITRCPRCNSMCFKRKQQ